MKIQCLTNGEYVVKLDDQGLIHTSTAAGDAKNFSAPEAEKFLKAHGPQFAAAGETPAKAKGTAKAK